METSGKLEAARLALLHAEQSVGLSSARSPFLSGISRNAADAVTEGSLARQAVESVPEQHAAAPWGDQSGTWEVPEELDFFFPRGLVKGTTFAIHGARFAAFLMAGVASKLGAWTACLGIPNMGWAGAAGLGIDVARTVCVSQTEGPAVLQALSAAIDGFDTVIVGRDIRLDARERRVMAKRALSRGTLLIAESWDARDRITSRFLGVEGVHNGSGHISAVHFELERAGVRPCRVRMDLSGWKVDEESPAVSSLQGVAHLEVLPQRGDAGQRKRSAPTSRPALRVVTP
ncbi:hypothetical protein [Changpingibacter yushuensis]|uniref:hypothetical protein n=1 Tax=Changpingibacter yushuensis TaxID=2758440 RepID=UPI00165DCCD2|nr:hypothetical protein [Changpingibacter yushuensis]